MLNKKEYSRYLSYLLRHNPLAANLHMNDQGFVFIDELIIKPRKPRCFSIVGKWQDIATEVASIRLVFV